MSWKRRVLWVVWGLSFGLGLVCLGVFMQGLIRDSDAGDAIIRVNFASPAGWVSAPFRVWGEGTYHLRISSVNHDPQFTGRPLDAEFEVQVIAPDGNAVLRQTYGAGATGHRVPDNYGDRRLATLDLNDWPLRRGELRVGVLKPDPNFITGQTELRLRKERYDPGMGGLINYVMVIPAGIFLLIALGVSFLLARAGSRAPLISTLVALGGFVIFVA
jgi:hypothetical protein